MGEHLCHGEWPNEQWNSYFEKDLDQTEWHTYGLNWSPGLAEFYIDRQVNRRIEADYVPDEPMYIVLNNGVQKVMENGEPVEDTGIYPNALEVDYIRLYKNRDSVSTSTITIN